MEQMYTDAWEEKETRKKIEAEFGITSLSGEAVKATRDLWQEAVPGTSGKFLDYYFENRAKDNVVFAVKKEKVQSMLHLTPYAAAMRRKPPVSGVRRPPCMADVARVEANLISVAATDAAYRQKGCMRKLLPGALAYQQRRNVPFCFVRTADGAFFERFGFHYIYDEPQYELDTERISMEMLECAADGGTVVLDRNPHRITLTAADNDSLLSLAHFVNANLCRSYGLFNIRSAVYYERLLAELKSRDGNLCQIMEDGNRKGYFAYTNDDACRIREVVFEQESDIGKYFHVAKEKKPAVMARIVNLSEMVKHISCNGKVTVAVRLKDPVLAENDGFFIWYIEETGSRMERVEQTNDSDEPSMRPEFTATIGEFTAFLFEYKKLKQNLKFDSIYLSGPAWMTEKY